MAVGKKVFKVNGTFTAPAGVTNVHVESSRFWPPAASGRPNNGFSGGFINSYGDAFCAGQNVNGQNGAGNVTSTSSPVLVVGGLSWKKIVGGSGNQLSTTSLGLTTTGKIYGWGTSEAGQVGANNTTTVSSPVLVVGGLSFANLIAGLDCQTNFGLTAGGALYGWGFNTSGALGNGTSTAAFSSPTLVVGGITNWIKVVTWGAQNNNTIGTHGLTADGTLYGWGGNTVGELGDGTRTIRSSPVLVLGSLTIQDFSVSAAITSESNTFIAMTTSGSVYCWSENSNGQCGQGSTAASSYSSPVAVVGGLKAAKVFCTNGRSSGAMGLIDTSGNAYMWGVNTLGMLGVGDTTKRSSPVQVVGGLKFDSIYTVAGTQGVTTASLFGITTDGSLYAWGANANGQLGVGDTTARSSPTLVVGGLNWRYIWQASNSSNVNFSTLGSSVYGMTLDGNIYAWGSNDFGNCGLGDRTPRSSPTLVLGGMAGTVTDTLSTRVIPVTPGTAYNVKFSAWGAWFGSYAVGQQEIDQITVSWNY